MEIPTTDGKAKPFSRAGRIRFDVDGVPVELTVFKDSDRGSLFIPFRDASAGRDTYEVGRYLEPQARPDGTLDVDFNYAYNPFCAYGEGWSCPIPPEENRLAVTIAGWGESVRRSAGIDVRRVPFYRSDSDRMTHAARPRAASSARGRPPTNVLPSKAPAASRWPLIAGAPDFKVPARPRVKEQFGENPVGSARRRESRAAGHPARRMVPDVRDRSGPRASPVDAGRSHHLI